MQHQTGPASGLPRTLLKVSGLTSHYGRIQALHGIDLEVKEGQLVALIGANGAGKTTLLRALSGVQPVTSGQALLFGEDMTGMTAQERVRRGVCQSPEGRQVFGPMSVEDNLRLGAYIRRDSEVASDLAQMFALFPVLETKRRLSAGTLSGGQQQMLALARALMGRPKLLLLDEPSMGLAPLLVQEIFNTVRQLRSQGKTILLVEQNARAALSIADHAYVMETGRTVLNGSGEELLGNEQVKRAYLGM
ncbi:MAG: ABC transporter ATP-binding protein [Pseudomonadota bacterium]